MKAHKTTSSFSKTSSGRRDLNNIRAPFADMSGAKSDFVSFNNADLSEVNCYRAELSLCELHDTNLNNAKLNQAVLICSSLSNGTILSNEANQADVSGCLLLLSSNDDGTKITREWLKNKGAKNSDYAITDLETLNEMLNASKIQPDTAEHYMEKINSIYCLLNSMKTRKETSMFIDPNWLPLLKYSTQENLALLKQAFTSLKEYILENESQSLPVFRF